jgi:hypothetical protein
MRRSPRSTTTTTPAPIDRPLAADQHPVAVYLASLRSDASRRTMADALTTAARVLAARVTASTLPWWKLRYQHLAALQAALLRRSSAGHGAGRSVFPGGRL